MRAPQARERAPDGTPSLGEVLRAFLWIGVVSFGGGRAAYFHEALVLRRRWIAPDAFLEAVALSQVFPGPTMANLAAHLGYRVRGAPGAAVAVGCVVLPGAFMILALAALYFRGLPPALATPIGRAVSAASVGIAVAAVVALRGGARGPGAHAVAALTFVLFGPLHWPVHWVLLLVLPVALALAGRRG